MAHPVSCLLLAAYSICAVAALPPSPDALALQAALDAAIARGDPSFTFPAGDVYFHDASFNITSPHDMTIGGSSSAPTTLFFAPSFGVSIANATRVELHDVTLDYSPLPYVHAVVTHATRKELFVTLAPSSLTFEAFAAAYPPHDTWPPCALFNSTDHAFIGPVTQWGRPAPATLVAGRDYSIACSGDCGIAEPGDVFVAPTRVGFTLLLSNTSAMAVTDVTLHAASSMAVTEFRGDGGNVYTRLRIIPRNTSGPLSSNADGFHSSGMRVGPTLRNSAIHNLLDDYFNVHNTFQLLVAAPTIGSGGDATILVGDYQLFPGSSALYGTQRTFDDVRGGETLSFFPLNTFSFPALASSTVVSVTRVPDDAATTSLLSTAYANASAAATNTPCSACHRGLNTFTSAQLWSVVISGAALPPSITPPVFVNADSTSCVGAVIEGCSFVGGGSNLGRFKSSGGRITNNTWTSTVHQNLEISPLQNYLEGPLGIHDISVENCTFYGTSANPIHIFGATGVTEVNNSFIPNAAVASHGDPDTVLVQAHVAAHAKDTFRSPSGYLRYPYLVPGGPYNQSWDWDSLFLGVALRHHGSTPYFVGTFKMFLEATNVSTGDLPGCLTPQGPSATLYHAKPLIIQGALLAGRQAGDVAQFSAYGDSMRALLRYWNSSTRRDATTGLHMWHDQLESGADNNVMSQCASPYSPECWTVSQAFTLSSPDVMVWLARELVAYALFIHAWQGLGVASGDMQRTPRAGLYANDWRGEVAGARAAASQLSDALNAHLWVCEETAPSRGCVKGYYGGYNVSTRAPIHARTFQAALPVWARLTPNASVAEMALESALLSDLSSPYGLRSTSSLDPRYSNADMINPYSNWRGPVWINVGVLQAHALRANGRTAAASALADALVRMLAEDLRATRTWHESYDSTDGHGLAAAGFLSWDTLGADVQADVSAGVDPFSLE